MDLPVKIKLDYPIQAGDERVEELIIERRPRAMDLKVMDQEKGEIAKSAALLAQLTDTPLSWIDRMDSSDFTRAAEVVGNFLS